jgi:hypothetical protein
MKYLVIPLTLLAFAPAARSQPPQRAPDLRQALEEYHPGAGSQQRAPLVPHLSRWQGGQPLATVPAQPQEPAPQLRQLSPEERAQLRRELAEYGNPPRRRH